MKRSLLAIVIALAFVVGNVSAAENLIYNGSFEQGSGQTAAGWSPVSPSGGNAGVAGRTAYNLSSDPGVINWFNDYNFYESVGGENFFSVPGGESTSQVLDGTNGTREVLLTANTEYTLSVMAGWMGNSSSHYYHNLGGDNYVWHPGSLELYADGVQLISVPLLDENGEGPAMGRWIAVKAMLSVADVNALIAANAGLEGSALEVRLVASGKGYDGMYGSVYNTCFDMVELAIPEPVTMSLLAAGGLALLRRRRK